MCIRDRARGDMLHVRTTILISEVGAGGPKKGCWYAPALTVTTCHNFRFITDLLRVAHCAILVFIRLVKATNELLYQQSCSPGSVHDTFCRYTRENLKRLLTAAGTLPDVKPSRYVADDSPLVRRSFNKSVMHSQTREHGAIAALLLCVSFFLERR